MSNQKKIKKSKDPKSFEAPGVSFDSLQNPTPAANELAKKIYAVAAESEKSFPEVIAALLLATQNAQFAALEMAGKVSEKESERMQDTYAKVSEVLAPLIFTDDTGLYATMGIVEGVLLYYNGLSHSRNKFLEEGGGEMFAADERESYE